MEGSSAFAFTLSLIAGLTTTVGGLFVVFAKSDSKGFLSFSLGFSGAVMIMVSISELFPESIKSICEVAGEFWGSVIVCAVLLIGAAAVLIIECLFPDSQKNAIAILSGDIKQKSALLRLGLIVMGTMMLHNFPEGIATFMASYKDVTLGVTITLAIALHNIPEGIAISMPIFYGTGSRGKAIAAAFVSGLSEPLGAFLAFLFLRPLITDLVLGIIFAFVCGIMLVISFKELLPEALKTNRFASSFGAAFGITAMMFAMILI